MAEETRQKLQDNEEHTDSVTLRAFHLFIEKAKAIDGATEKTTSNLCSLFDNQSTATAEGALDALIASRTQHAAEQENGKDQGN